MGEGSVRWSREKLVGLVFSRGREDGGGRGLRLQSVFLFGSAVLLYRCAIRAGCCGRWRGAKIARSMCAQSGHMQESDCARRVDWCVLDARTSLQKRLVRTAGGRHVLAARWRAGHCVYAHRTWRFAVAPVLPARRRAHRVGAFRHHTHY